MKTLLEYVISFAVIGAILILLIVTFSDVTLVKLGY